jgi:hypothetical protein
MAKMTNDASNTTREYYEISDFPLGSSSDSYKELWENTTESSSNLESKVGEFEIFVRFTLSGIEYELGSHPVFYNEAREENEVVSLAREFILENANEGLLAQVEPFLDAFDAMGEPLLSMDLPPLGVSIPEQNTILIEWVLPRLRVGLFFEEAAEESSWYILSRNIDKELNAWGYLSTTGTEELTALILDQVFEFA